MSGKAIIGSIHPIDAVILWVDGNDPLLATKRDIYLRQEKLSYSHPGAYPTLFASNDEIRYSVLSILRFAPFVRKIFIVTDGQDPGLHDYIKAYFPERTDSLIIVDHKEIFRGYEHCLPTFNSASIHSMIWQIEGLSENFVYLNDDIILIREHQPYDWFIDDRPVLRGKWRLPPIKKIISASIKTLIYRKILGNRDYQPGLSFYIRQWKSAYLSGRRFRYFFHCHTPHPLKRSRLEKIFRDNRELMEKTISCRFRSSDQLLMSSLAYHQEIEEKNRNFADMNLCYLHPIYSKKHITRKIKGCISDQSIKTVCIQSLDMIDSDTRDEILNWIGKLMDTEDPISPDKF